jgi:perosamine synthetase
VQDVTLPALGHVPRGPHGEIAPEATTADIRGVLSALLAQNGPDENQAITDLERAVERYLNDEVFAVATDNGTNALYMALIGAGVRPGDEVVVPALSFVASSAAVHATGATPVFADIDPETFTLTVDTIAHLINDRTRAVMAVHTHGLPADLDSLLHVTRISGLELVEDAAQAFGALYRGRRVGTFGISAGVSHNKAKPWGSKDGGIALVRRDHPEAARAARLLASFGEERPACAPGERRSYWSRHFGVNLRTHPLVAAYALSTFGPDGALHDARLRVIQHNAKILSNGIRRVTGLRPPVVPDDCTSTFAYFRVMIDPVALGYEVSQSVHIRDAVIQELDRRRVPADTWQFDPLPAMPSNRTVGPPQPYRPGAPMPELLAFDPEAFPVTVNTLNSSFILATPEFPLWAQTPATIRAWVEEVAEVFAQLDQLMARPHDPLRIAPPILDSDR